METRTRIAAIIIKNNKLLMLKGKSYDELWTPGGKIEEGETEEECLRREIDEEIGVSITHFHFFGEYLSKSFYHADITIHEKVYIAAILGEAKPDAEIEKIIWLSKKEFENKLFPMIPNTEEKVIPDLIQAGLF